MESIQPIINQCEPNDDEIDIDEIRQIITSQLLNWESNFRSFDSLNQDQSHYSNNATINMIFSHFTTSMHIVDPVNRPIPKANND